LSLFVEVEVWSTDDYANQRLTLFAGSLSNFLETTTLSCECFDTNKKLNQQKAQPSKHPKH